MKTNEPASEYPPDYDEYLEDCYDIDLGNVTESYDEWKARQPR